MKKQLFFDDSKLFGRDNAVRKQGTTKVLTVYNDGVSSTDYYSPYVFRLDDGRYRMIYQAHGKEFDGKKMFVAISEDGVNFSPEKICDPQTNPDKMFSHELMNLDSDGVKLEIANIYEDVYCENPKERYKLLMSEFHVEKLSINDTVYTSENLIDWKLKETAGWGEGTEPLTSVFFNKHWQTYTVILRPFWGCRCVGYKETKDWQTFSKYTNCLDVDHYDEPLSEIYGMNASEYDDMYIGITHIYRQLKSEFNAKYSNGIIDTQLAYSYDGRYWRRFIREPFISGLDKNPVYNLMWVSSMQKNSDGSINFYGSGSEHEHGPAFENPGTGKIFVHNMRADGFASLCTDDITKPASVITREKIWHGGELSVNIKAKKATVGVFVTQENENLSGMNVLGKAVPVQGYGHEDCIAFEGDCINWVPQYKSGKKIDDLAGKTIVFEIKFEDGSLYSLSGDYTDVYNTQAARYRKFGTLPE